MSERRLLLLLLLLACALTSAPVQAQELERLKRREAELTAQFARLQSEAVARTDDLFWRQARDVRARGPLIVAYPQGTASEVVGALPVALDAEQARYGIALDSLLTDTLYAGMEVPGAGSAGRVPKAIWRLGALHGELSPVGDWLNSTVGAALQSWSGGLLDPKLRSWLGAVDGRASVATLRDPLLRDLVGSPSSRAHRCLNGATEDCRLLLELDEGPTPLLAAYDPTDLPTIFGRMDLNVRIRGRANCTGKRDPAACAELVRRGVVLPPHPVSPRARQSLFAYALAAGGEGAWLRLHRAQGIPIAEQLSVAAARPIDSLLVAWQRDLRTGRRTTATGLAPSLMLALAWGTVTILFFAWRYRWRHV